MVKQDKFIRNTTILNQLLSLYNTIHIKCNYKLFIFFQQIIRKYNKYIAFENIFKIKLFCLVLVYTSTT